MTPASRIYVYGNYWARGSGKVREGHVARARSASATWPSRTFSKPNNFRRVYERRRYFNWFVVENERGLARRQSSVSEVDLICRISQGRSLASQTLLQEGGLASETTKSVVPTIVRLRRKITRERFSLGYRIRGHRFVPLFYPSEKRSSPQAVLTFPKLFYNFPNCSTFST